MVGEPTLIDTNVLAYALYADSPHHPASQTILEKSSDPGAGYFVAAQNLFELFSVITNPRRVTSVFSPREAVQVIETILLRPGIMILPPVADIVPRCLGLIRGGQISGRQVFDAQLAATMLEHGIRRICTFNVDDFARFEGIEATAPSVHPAP